jgi:hypothetical protein
MHQSLDLPQPQQLHRSFHGPFVQIRAEHVRISFIIRKTTTPFASAASIIKEVVIRLLARQGLKKAICTSYSNFLSDRRFGVSPPGNSFSSLKTSGGP